MSSQRNPITEDTYLIQPKKQGAYPIKESDLNRLEAMISQIPPIQKLFHNLAMALLGIAGGALVTLLTIKDMASVEWRLIGGIFLVTSVFTVVFWVIDKRQREA